LIGIRSKQLIGLIIIFIAITEMVVIGLTSKYDDSISRYFKSIQGNKILDAVMITIASFGDNFTLVTLAIILTIIRRSRKMGMIFLITIMILAILIIYIKPLVGRTLPPYTFQPALRLPNRFVLEDDSLVPFARNLSYPSNHVATATALAFIIGFEIDRKSRIGGLLLWTFPVIVAIARMYLMQHYLTDVIAGFVFGLIISIILSNLMKLDQPFVMSRFKGKKG
jgi:undecaprenyl-diphosphatase